MNDQLQILITLLKISVKKHGAETPVTLGHLLNICKLAKQYERKIEEREDAEHRALLNEISNNGQF